MKKYLAAYALVTFLMMGNVAQAAMPMMSRLMSVARRYPALVLAYSTKIGLKTPALFSRPTYFSSRKMWHYSGSLLLGATGFTVVGCAGRESLSLPQKHEELKFRTRTLVKGGLELNRRFAAYQEFKVIADSFVPVQQGFLDYVELAFLSRDEVIIGEVLEEVSKRMAHQQKSMDRGLKAPVMLVSLFMGPACTAIEGHKKFLDEKIPALRNELLERGTCEHEINAILAKHDPLRDMLTEQYHKQQS